MVLIWEQIINGKLRAELLSESHCTDLRKTIENRWKPHLEYSQFLPQNSDNPHKAGFSRYTCATASRCVFERLGHCCHAARPTWEDLCNSCDQSQVVRLGARSWPLSNKIDNEMQWVKKKWGSWQGQWCTKIALPDFHQGQAVMSSCSSAGHPRTASEET